MASQALLVPYREFLEYQERRRHWNQPVPPADPAPADVPAAQPVVPTPEGSEAPAAANV